MVWKEFVSAFAQEFLAIVLPVLATLLAGLVVSWITKVAAEVKAKIDSRYIWMLDEAARVAVLAAEQTNLAGMIQDKKAYALQVAELWLKDRGFKIDITLLEARIEAAVMEEFNRNKLEESSGVTEPTPEA